MNKQKAKQRLNYLVQIQKQQHPLLKGLSIEFRDRTADDKSITDVRRLTQKPVIRLAIKSSFFDESSDNVDEFDFVEAVETVMGQCAGAAPVYEKESRSYENQSLLLPQKSPSNDVVTQYLFSRGIDYEIINYCLDKELIIESLPYHNVVFIGYDEKKEAKYAAFRATNNSRIMGDCTGSKKQFSFRLTNEESREVHLFECAIDLLSYATLAKMEGRDWHKLNLVSLSGVYSPNRETEKSKVPVTLKNLLEKNKNINRIVLHFDNDIAGRKAANALKIKLKDRYEVVDDPPKCGKDVNDFLCIKLGISKKNERSFER